MDRLSWLLISVAFTMFMITLAVSWVALELAGLREDMHRTYIDDLEEDLEWKELMKDVEQEFKDCLKEETQEAIK